MRQLSRFQNILFLVGGALMVIGAGLYVFGFCQPASWIFLVGALLFSSMQLNQSYDGDNFVIRRLRRIMVMADILFVLAGLLMVENAYNFLLPFFQNHVRNGLNAYIIYIMGKWVVLLLVAAILEVYTTHRISNELEKEAKKR
ncbi:MAG: hypothetical protein IKZ93_01270 [Prevotella sp.]|nr:hypothetical protein [Prevotella sp.]